MKYWLNLIMGGGWLTGLSQDMRRSELVKRYLITRSAHTPKPEVMFEHLIKAGIARIQRRRGLPPRLVFLKEV